VVEEQTLGEQTK